MKPNSKKAELRLSQIITTFGPGAMVDLPTRSVIIGGLERWDMREGNWRSISEPRASQLLQERLVSTGRIQPGITLGLRTPPLDPQLIGREPPGIAATVFPCWFVTEAHEQTASGRRRRLVRWSQLDAAGGRRRFTMDDGVKTEVTPIRFVAACERGHIQDIDWAWVVHGGDKCAEPLWLEEKGTTGEPRNTRVVCGCGRGLSLEQAQIPGRFGKCTGKQPWLLADAGGCGKELRFLTRTATNAYFPQVLTVISLPSSEDALTRRVQEHWSALAAASNAAEVGMARKFNPAVAAALEGYDDASVFDRIERVRKAVLQDLDKKPKYAEFELFASGQRLIGENRPDAELHGETLERNEWGGVSSLLAPIGSVVAVHRLREVSCLYGFTRFEAAPTSIDGDIEEVFIAVDGATLAGELTWLPAVEQFGEGIFLHFDPAKIREWIGNQPVLDRDQMLQAGFQAWAAVRFEGKKPPSYPGAPYIMLHSLSHALMAEVTLECGYPATALKERVYALPEEGAAGRFGILIYTATAGAQGTLGGLLSIIPRLGTIIGRSLDKLAICSSDPICADNRPENHADDRALHGAACHSCLLVPETSCEYRNLFLDRALVAQTISIDSAALFSG
jgi:hypothetical protein